MQLPEIKPFCTKKNHKNGALKILEEAAEVIEAVKEEDIEHIKYECMDVIQATVNLLTSYGLDTEDMIEPYAQVYKSNMVKGRYRRHLENLTE